MFLSIGMLKLNYFLADIFILSAEKQPIKLSWRKIECLHYSFLFSPKIPTFASWKEINWRCWLASCFPLKSSATFQLSALNRPQQKYIGIFLK